MAHMMTFRADGRAEMAYVGEKPWHGHGQELSPGQSIEVWRDEAGLNWEILATPVLYTAPDGTVRAHAERVVLHRSDTGAALGVVSDGYKPVHPDEILEFFRDLTENLGYQLETAGSLAGGRKLWALAYAGDSAAVGDKRDTMKDYLLLSTACDGSACTEGRKTAIRVVCNNTLSYARESGNALVKVTHRMRFDADAAKQAMGVTEAHSGFASAMEDFRRLAQTPMRPADVIGATAELFYPGFAGMDAKEQDKILHKPSSPIAAVGRLALDQRAKGSDFAGTRDTAWGWLNAVTEYVDHTGRAHNAENRLASAWFGKGNATKSKAFEVALQLADGTTVTQLVEEAVDAGSGPLAIASLPALPPDAPSAVDVGFGDLMARKARL